MMKAAPEQVEATTFTMPWSAHWPGLIMGSSQRTLFCLGVYGSICKYLNLTFVFGGTKECWEKMHIDGSDARLVAEQHIWAATNEKHIPVMGKHLMRSMGRVSRGRIFGQLLG